MQLAKRKTYDKRCRHMLQHLRGEYEGMLEKTKSGFPEVRSGDIVTVHLVRMNNAAACFASAL